MRLFAMFAAAASVLSSAETKIALEKLPAAVQAAVKEQTKHATLLGITTEKAKGKTVYEAETTVAGQKRDILFASDGSVIETEEEVDMNSLPTAARAAITKRAGGGAVTKVEKLTAGPTVSYEAAVRRRSGKVFEIGVNADGTPHKD